MLHILSKTLKKSREYNSVDLKMAQFFATETKFEKYKSDLRTKLVITSKNLLINLILYFDIP